MMRRTISLTAICLVALAGCGGNDSAPAPQADAAKTGSTPAAPAEVKPAAETKPDAAPAATLAATPPPTPAPTPTPTPTPVSAPTPTLTVNAVADAKPAETKPAAAANDTTAKATALLEQLTQYIKDNKLDLADKALKQLDGMKSSLPASFASKIELARTALTAQKASNMFK